MTVEKNMTVEQLIEILKTKDQKSKVFVWMPDSGSGDLENRIRLVSYQDKVVIQFGRYDEET